MHKPRSGCFTQSEAFRGNGGRIRPCDLWVSYANPDLKGVDTGIIDVESIRYFLPGPDEWRTVDSSPPTESSLMVFALRADGIAPDAGDSRFPELAVRLDLVSPAGAEFSR